MQGIDEGRPSPTRTFYTSPASDTEKGRAQAGCGGSPWEGGGERALIFGATPYPSLSPGPRVPGPLLLPFLGLLPPWVGDASLEDPLKRLEPVTRGSPELWGMLQQHFYVGLCVT